MNDASMGAMVGGSALWVGLFHCQRMPTAYTECLGQNWRDERSNAQKHDDNGEAVR